MEFVLDNSVSLRWCLPSAKKADQDYAAWVLSTAFVSSAAVVPGIWHLEVANTLRRAEKFGELSEGQSDTFIRRLEALPISADPDTVREAIFLFALADI